ncbi:DegT/DnrJ/EryC1/StrS family aminotransferase [Streptomyces sp. NPDC057654]|uniref:DegT/DnrJ/EryC1/StrS family aminotransferase n=1 Tax=Streptomyces sp. NPDC057654 TaxID=3346196 RepID=UPI0036C8ACC5
MRTGDEVCAAGAAGDEVCAAVVAGGGVTSASVADDDECAAAVAELASRFGQPGAALTATGAAALEVALEIFGIGRGDEVAVPDLGCHALAAAVVRAGATPVFIGVGPSLTLNPADVASCWSRRTRAVIVPHQYGLPCDVRGIVAAVPPDAVVIEDVAQTWGSYAGEAVSGATGVLAVTSFGPSKPVALGAGGAVLGPVGLLAGAVAQDGAGDRLLDRVPSPARFPRPLLERLPGALRRADERLAARRAVVREFLTGELSACFRLPPLPPDSGAGWTRLPLYPLPPVSGMPVRELRRILEPLGPVQELHAVPPSGLPMFRRVEKVIFPGGKRPADPLLVKPT